MNGYELSRKFFDWSFENPEKINSNHVALYFFCIEHCNRLGWKHKFGLPTTMAKEAIGIRSYNTYIKTLNELIDFGFITLIEKSKNQYSSNIIAISNFNKALDKALDKAFIKHATKQDESIQQSNDSIIKQLTIEQENNKQINKEIDYFEKFQIDFCEENMIIPFENWLNFIKYEHRQQCESSYRRLIELSKNNSIEAKKIVDYSISGNYKNLYKEENKFKKEEIIKQPVKFDFEKKEKERLERLEKIKLEGGPKQLKKITFDE